MLLRWRSLHSSCLLLLALSMSRDKPQKHERMAIRAVQELGEALEVAFMPGSKHRKIQVIHAGCTSVEVPVSCSPSSGEAQANSIRQLVRRAFRAKGVEL